MFPHIAAWDKYRGSVRQFDAVLEYAKAVSSSLVGITTPSSNASYGEQIFVTILGQCITLRRLTPDPNRRTPNELWDLPSMANAKNVVSAKKTVGKTATPAKKVPAKAAKKKTAASNPVSKAKFPRHALAKAIRIPRTSSPIHGQTSSVQLLARMRRFDF